MSELLEEASGKKLAWFFEVYLRQPALPRLISESKDNQLILRWDVPNNLPFPMPVEVKMGENTERYEVRDGQITISLKPGAPPVIDPKRWLLKAE